jgi:AraC-like DNA-binding protein
MPTHRVVALVREAEEQARIRGALRDRGGALVPCESANDVLAALSEGPAVAVVVSAYGPTARDGVALTRTLRVRYPALPVLVYHDPQSTSPRQLLAFFQAGAAEVVQKGEDFRHAFASILANAGHKIVARRLLEKLNPVLPPQAKPLFEYLLAQGEAPLSIEQAAAAVGIARRTLEKRLARLGYPAPETLIGWCRLLLAAHLLEEQGRSFDDVALELSFPSGMALRSMLKRYTGVTGREARTVHGPVALVLMRLTEQLSTPQAAAAVQKSRATEQAIEAALSPE